jgi:hypothetical protein
MPQKIHNKKEVSIMAKKIRLDFSKTEERSGWNTKHIAEGLHKMKIESVQETEAQDGTAMLVYALVPADPKLKTRRFPFYCKLQQNQLWKLRDLLVAAGQTVPKKAVQIDPAVVVGKLIAAEVEDDVYQGNIRSSVNGTYGLDILDEDEGSASSEDEDEEEYEGDEDEGEEEDDEEEVDLEALSLPALRKMAKELGIDHTGLKKADLIEAIEEEEGEEDDEDEDDDLEDEDLDDDELYDDDEEDEEEEEPAPKRRATPRKVAPAKAAPKRAVKRR